jgi:diguanylate cyclase (GGDEF)-like protein
MTSSHPQPHTALSLLFGDDAPGLAIHRLWDGETGAGVKSALVEVAPILQKAAKVEITARAVELLQFDLIGMLVTGWRKYEDLVAAALRTVASPGSTELVQVAQHRVTATVCPYVDILVGEADAATVHFELSVVFDVSLLATSISSGRIVALHSGNCDISATLLAEGTEVASGREHVDLPVVVSLGQGIPLLSAHAAEEARRSSDQDAEAVLRDPATGLPNRLLFLARLAHAMLRALRSHKAPTVLFVELDPIQEVNDIHGQKAGEDLLCAVAGRLTRTLRSGDTLARQSSHEILVLCEDLSDPSEAHLIVARLDAALTEPFGLAGYEVAVVARIGVAHAGPNAARPEHVIHAAEIAVPRATGEGADRGQIIDLRADRTEPLGTVFETDRP